MAHEIGEPGQDSSGEHDAPSPNDISREEAGNREQLRETETQDKLIEGRKLNNPFKWIQWEGEPPIKTKTFLIEMMDEILRAGDDYADYPIIPSLVGDEARRLGFPKQPTPSKSRREWFFGRRYAQIQPEEGS